MIYFDNVEGEPEMTKSDDKVIIGRENRIIETSFRVPFQLDSESTVVDLNVTSGDNSDIKLTNWVISEVDEDSSTTLISCTCSLDTTQLESVDNLPVFEITVSNYGGSSKHSHTTILEIGSFSRLLISYDLQLNAFLVKGEPPVITSPPNDLLEEFELGQSLKVEVQFESTSEVNVKWAIDEEEVCLVFFRFLLFSPFLSLTFKYIVLS